MLFCRPRVALGYYVQGLVVKLLKHGGGLWVQGVGCRTRHLTHALGIEGFSSKIEGLRFMDKVWCLGG